MPVIFGITLAGLDLAVWILFLSHWFLHRQELFLGEGLMLMMVLHFPASFLLPLLGSVLIALLDPFFPGAAGSLAPQAVFLLVVGLAQYYLLGYFIGWIVMKIRRHRGHGQAISPEPPERTAGRGGLWAYNILYLLFTFTVLQMLIEIVSGLLLDFEMYKMNYPPTRHYLELSIGLAWLFATYRIIRYNRSRAGNGRINKRLLYAGISLLVLFAAVYIPKLSISDIPDATGLEKLYAGQQAGIFFDNPIERLIIMKTAIVGMDEHMMQVEAFTFFGLPYRLTDIERVGRDEMRRLLISGLAGQLPEETGGNQPAGGGVTATGTPDVPPGIHDSNPSGTGKLKAVDCLPEQRKAEACDDIYQPVCGQVQVECIKAPCYPVKETFGNPCQACLNPRVLSYTEGECPEDGEGKY